MIRILFCVFFFIVLQSFGQTKIENDTTSIVSFVDKIIVKANIDTKSESFSFKQSDNTNFTMLTNNEYRLALSLDYEFIGASIGFSPKFIPGNNDDNLKGESSFIDYRFRFFLQNWTQEIGYSKVKGFYIDNTADFISGWVEGQDPYIQFPDIKITTWEGSTSYVFNNKFSLRNVTYNTEWQLKSSGSFTPTLKYRYSLISARLDASNKIYEKTYEIRMSPDYYYTFGLIKIGLLHHLYHLHLVFVFLKKRKKSQMLLKTTSIGLWG